MASLKAINARLDEIERKFKQGQREPLTIVRKIVRPGHVGEELTRLQDHRGNKWLRDSGETEDQFIERAHSLAGGNRHGVATLLGNVATA